MTTHIYWAAAKLGVLMASLAAAVIGLLLGRAYAVKQRALAAKVGLTG